MKIYDSNLSGAASTGAQRTQEAQQTGRSNAGSASAGGGQGGDRVEFSGALGRLSQALGAFQNGRAERVQALTGQYRSGSYRADSTATSRAMITEVLSASSGAGLH
jgi:anti-sigma28 factor (negative regulator of flagellin synthesis)